MTTDAEIRRKRGTVRRSLTNIAKKIAELEAMEDKTEAGRRAQRLSKRVTELDGEFKAIQYQVLSTIDDTDTSAVASEQGALDKHDDELDDMSLRLQALIDNQTHNGTLGERSISRTLSSLEDSLSMIKDGLDAITPGEADELLLQQYQEELSDLKIELVDCRNRLCRLELPSDHELSTQFIQLKAGHFEACHSVRKISSTLTTPTGDETPKGLKVPKLEAPTFDGDLLNWTQFWEQFRVSIDQRTNLSNAEKLVYLQQSLKGGTARSVIQGLSSTGEHYEKAIECLKARYDRPRQIHQSHVKTIMEATPLKHGSGRELRRLHDILLQHLRALDAADSAPLSQFITSVIQLKLDQETLFEWQKHTQSTNEVPHYKELLEFIDLRARASESTSKRVPTGHKSEHKAVVNAASVSDTSIPNCVLCQSEKHPLYHCSRFKGIPYHERLTTIKEHRLCMNCLKHGHFLRECKSVHHCKHCQKPHHTLLHIDSRQNPNVPPDTTVSSNASAGTTHNTLLMTCQVWVVAPDGSKVKARALLDPASSSSFVSERLVQGLGLPRSRSSITVSGVAGLRSSSPLRSIADVTISPAHSTKHVSLSAVVVPHVTSDLPLSPVKIKDSWTHLNNISLADPQFDIPGRIDLLLGVEVYVEVLLNGRRSGPAGSPTAFQTLFGWVLAGRIQPAPSPSHIISHHVSTQVSGDDLLRKFWEMEEPPRKDMLLSMEDQCVINHFKQSYCRNQECRFFVPLARRSDARPLGESRSQAVRRFMNLERSLTKKGQFKQLDNVIMEYFELGHAEPVPDGDLLKPQGDVFYLPIHAVTKMSSTTTKLRAVFDASAKSSTGVSLNDQLLVGPTVHSPLIDVLLRFRQFCIAITTDISKMYRAIGLVEKDRDLHRFVWRSSSSEPIRNYRMTRLTFGVSASSFVANMCVKENALIHSHRFPLAARAVDESFYVDDGLTGADDESTAIKLQKEMSELFKLGGFTLHKWNSNSQAVLSNINPELRDNEDSHPISDIRESTKTLGFVWRTKSDCFHLTICDSPFSSGDPTKRTMVSDVARVFDVLGWFAPAVISVKILLQRLWECGIGWDDPVPSPICDLWSKWKLELPCLSDKSIPRCYYPKGVRIVHKELHGFSDASENAYAAVVYLRMVDVEDHVHVMLVAAKTKVAPLKRITIPRLELCGALLLSKLVSHVKEVLGISMEQVITWTDSTVVLCWLTGSPRRFKTFVGNRVAQILDQIPVDRWRHVAGKDNPADCASRGLYPSELIGYQLWWNGPSWLKLQHDEWPERVPPLSTNDVPELEEVTLTHNTAVTDSHLIRVDRFSSFERLQRVTSWLFRFIKNCQSPQSDRNRLSFVTVPELQQAERYLCKMVQRDCFSTEIRSIESKHPLPRGNCLLPLCPFVDSDGILRVGGRQRYSNASYSKVHPIILHSKHAVVKLVIRSEHKRLLHGGPTVVMASLSRRYHIVRIRQAVRNVTQKCTTCRRWSVKPKPPAMGQLPIERITPGPIFDKTGLDYAGPILIKYGHVRKPVVVKAYVCVFVSLTVKAVHLEVVSDLTSEAFLACLRRFIARRGYPSLLWSDHGTNFVGAQREIKELLAFLEKQSTRKAVSKFCSAQRIEWRFIPQRSPHFGGIWEAAVKSFKGHLRRIVGDVKLTYEEASTVLTQIECCLNSRPLVPTGNTDDLEVLTPGHFLIGQPLAALPDPAITYQSTLSLLKRWHLCQNVVRHFWQRWYHEYLSTLQKIYKWRAPTRNMSVDDVVLLIEDEMIPTKWPTARIVNVYPGRDGVVRVADVKTSKGIYRRPIHKLAPLIDE